MDGPCLEADRARRLEVSGKGGIAGKGAGRSVEIDELRAHGLERLRLTAPSSAPISAPCMR